MKEMLKKELLLDLADSIITSLSDDAGAKVLLSDASLAKLLNGCNEDLVEDVKQWEVISFVCTTYTDVKLRDECGETMATFGARHINGIAIAKAILAIVLDYVNY